MIRTLLRATGAFLATLAYGFGVRKAVTVENLAKAYPQYSDVEISRIAKDSFKNLGRVFGEFLYLRFASRKAILRKTTITNLELLTNAAAKGRGLILISAHLCDWEWLAIAVGLRFQALNVVIKNQTGKAAERFLNRMRVRFGNKMIDAGNVRRMFQALNRNESLAILADQSAPSTSAIVTFFGRRVPAFEGPARLALRTRSPLLFVDCERNPGGTYSITIHDVPYGDLTDTSEESVRELTQRHLAVAEQCIRTDPARWLWQHRRWKNAV